MHGPECILLQFLHIEDALYLKLYLGMDILQVIVVVTSVVTELTDKMQHVPQVYRCTCKAETLSAFLLIIKILEKIK